MEWLDITYNDWEGDVPDELKQWRNMRYCDMRGNARLKPLLILGEEKAIGNVRDYRAWSAPPPPAPEVDPKPEEGEEEEEEEEEEEKEEAGSLEKEVESEPEPSEGEVFALDVIGHAQHRIEVVQVVARRMVDKLLDPPPLAHARRFLLSLLGAMQSSINEERECRRIERQRQFDYIEDLTTNQEAVDFVNRCYAHVERMLHLDGGGSLWDGQMPPAVFTRVASTVEDCARVEASRFVRRLLTDASDSVWAAKRVAAVESYAYIERLVSDAIQDGLDEIIVGVSEVTLRSLLL
jgi:hypothetical protein